MKWLKNPSKSIMLMLSMAMLTFSVNTTAVSSSGYKLPDRSELITVPQASTPYRMRWLIDCDSVPANCLLNTSSLFTPWQDIDEPFDFTAWTPIPKLQTLDFSQSREYQQAQQRYEQKRYIHKETSQYSNDGLPVRHEQDVTRTESRVVATSYTQWVNDGENHSCLTWTPAQNTIPWGQSFEQTRGCLEPEIRDRVYIAQATELSREIERRNVAVSEVQQNTGNDDFITKTESDTPPAWADFGTKTCDVWTPEPSTVWDDETFTQTRECTIGQERNVSYFDYWASGAPRTENRVEREAQVRDFSEDKEVSGEKVLWSATSDNVTPYADSGFAGYTSWSPATSTQTSSFVQARTKTQPQSRTRYTREVSLRDGSFQNTSSTTENRNDVSGESRTVTIGSTGYVNYGSATGCGGYSPSTSTVDYGRNFTQTGSCTQPTRNTYSFSTGGSHYKSSSKSVSDTITATGTKTVITSASSSFTSWTNYSTSYGSYSPLASTQTSNFTQTRSRTYAQQRYEQPRQYRNGVLENVGSPIRRTQSVSGGTTSRTVTVGSTGYVNYGSATGCGGYSPSTSTVDYGTNFTQTGSCTQPTRNTYSFSIGGSHYKSSSKSVSDTITATGTKTVITSASSSFTSWTNYSTSYGSYSPLASTQTSNFTQTRSRTYAQQRYEQPRQYRNGVLENVGSPIRRTQSVSGGTTPRTITATWGSWFNNGSASYTAWSGTAANATCSTTTTTQTSTKSQARKRYIVYNYSLGNGPAAYKTDTNTEYQTLSGTKNCTPVANCSGTYYIESHSEYGESNELYKRWDYPDGGYYSVDRVDGKVTSTSGTEKNGAYYTGDSISSGGGQFSSNNKYQLCI
jgi:hypothetical protein